MLLKRHQFGLLLAIILFYLLNSLVIFHIGLSADGAHYALYGVHFNIGYVDHPPLIGWLQALILRIFHYHTASAHIIALISSLGSLLLLYQLSKTLFPQRSNTFAVACALSYFIAVVLNALTFLALTQGPLIFFSLLSCLCLWYYCQKPSWPLALAFGLNLGFAALADYTALLLTFGLCLYCLFYAKQVYKQFSFYSAFVIASLCFSPFLWWNAHHNWISFHSGYHHSFSGGFSWHLCLQTIITHLAGYSPFLVIFGIAGTISAFRHDEHRALLLAIPAAVIILAISYAGCHQKMFFHWPALGWVLLIPLACNQAARYWHAWLAKIIICLSAVISALVYILFYSQVFFGCFHFPIGRYPLNDLYGWSSIAKRAVVLEKATSASDQHASLFVPNWSLASRLAWYSHQPVQILKPSPIAGYLQFVQWYGKPNKHSNGIVVVPHRWQHPALLSYHLHTFRHCRKASSLKVMRHHHIVNTVDYYHCWGWIA